jgi:histidyl-tRNA synthetase
LDCKEEKCQRIRQGAPQTVDYLCKECHNHFKEVLELLDGVGLPYYLDPFLVRGLDYYTKTVFEVFEKGNDSALIGGGRYDDLADYLGGESVPAVGMAGGVERLIEGMKEKPLRYPQKKAAKVFLASVGRLATRRSLKLQEKFWKAGIPIAEALSKGALRVQLSRANKLGVKYTLILGHKELLEGRILLRNMKTGSQVKLRLKNLTEKIKEKLR